MYWILGGLSIAAFLWWVRHQALVKGDEYIVQALQYARAHTEEAQQGMGNRVKGELDDKDVKHALRHAAMGLYNAGIPPESDTALMTLSRASVDVSSKRLEKLFK